ncbi:MAG TPA: hypothetical protein VMJ33_06730 [Gallionella sp.]|nr:hypothetical protein [Gallionella sp.]
MDPEKASRTATAELPDAEHQNFLARGSGTLDEDECSLLGLPLLGHGTWVSG